MKTRKVTPKKTPPAKKSAVKTKAEPTSVEQANVKSPETPIVTSKRTPTPKPTETKRTPNTRSKKSTETISTDATPSPVTAGKESTSSVGASASSISAIPLSSSGGGASASSINATTPSSSAVVVSASSTEAKPAVEATNTPDDVGQTATGPKRGTVKVIRKVVRKVVRKVPKGTLEQAPKSQKTEKAAIEENPEKAATEENPETPLVEENPEKPVIEENPEKPVIEENREKNDTGMALQLNTAGNDPVVGKADSISSENSSEKSLKEESTVVNAASLTEVLTNSSDAEAAKRAEESFQAEKTCAEISSKRFQEQDIVAMEVNSVEVINSDKQQKEAKSKEEQEGEPKAAEVKVESMEEQGEEPKLVDAEAKWNSDSEKTAMDEEPKEGKTDFDSLLEEADDDGIPDPEFHEEVVGDDSEKNMIERCEEAMKREEEHAEVNAAAQERRLRKEFEIFVGGLDREVVEEDLKRVFQHAGEVVDVRLYKVPTTNKNKGYGFVRFSEKDHVAKALAEMKNPVIRGKRCGIAPSEDNDTLFVGNICNTWTKEAINQKLKDYGIKSVENINLVTDPKHEGLSRGFAFVEFSCHAEAVKAFNRLQKPDAVLGHAERTAKVAFAEPLREPDPEVMAKVKSVFIDGLPPHWDEDHVREEFKRFGGIEHILLARNMSSAKRKDFGFVDFTTHDGAVACIDGINNTELGDGNYKAKVRARLANPEPKTQAVKGEMVGGFRIAQSSAGTFPRYDRGFGRADRGFGRADRGFERARNAFNRGNFQPSHGFFPSRPDYGGYMGFGNGHGFGGSYPPFHEGQNLGRGGGWGFRSAYPMPNERPPPIRPNLGRGRGGANDTFRRQPYIPEEGLERPYPGRQFDDPYFYDDSARGVKRPYQMNDQNPDYMGPSNRRARYDYGQPPTSHHDGLGTGGGGGPYPQDYHDYGRGMHQSFYGGDRSYGRGYYH